MTFERVLSRYVAVKNLSDNSRWTFHHVIHLPPTKVEPGRCRKARLSRSRGVRRPWANEPAPTRLLWTGCGPDLAARRRHSVGRPSPCLRSRRADARRRTPRRPWARQVAGRGDDQTNPPGRQRIARLWLVRWRAGGVGQMVNGTRKARRPRRHCLHTDSPAVCSMSETAICSCGHYPSTRCRRVFSSRVNAAASLLPELVS